MTHTTRSALALVFAAGAAASAQPPNDNCSSATAISGFQTFTFDNTLATQDGVGNATCNLFGTNQIDKDVWFCWTAAQAGPVQLTTCSLTSIDTKIAVYDGCGCPEGAGILACSDDNCGTQTTVSWSALIGHSYLIRLGVFPGAAGGTGSFTIQSGILAGPIANPANNHTYFLLTPSTWTAGEASAVALGGHLTTIRSADENEFIRASVLGFDGMDRRGWIGLWDPNGTGNFVWTGGEPLNYTNWNGGEPNNIGVERWVELFYSNGQWNNNVDNPPFNEYPIVELVGSACYANCDGSTAVPFLNIADFVCFQSAFAAGSSYANCDHSTAPPVLNIADFVCFQASFAAGCSAP
jgi:hypothetical protein